MSEKIHEVTIKADQGYFQIDWKALFDYRDLLFLLVRKELVSKYKQTILGPFWFIIQPVLTAMTFAIVFSHFAKISTEKSPSILFYFCGLVPWGYFSQCVSTVSLSLITNAHIFKKVYFPRLIIPLSIVISGLAAMLIQFLVFLGLLVYYHNFHALNLIIAPTQGILGTPFFILQTALLSLGIGICVSAFTIKYRDLQHLITFTIQLFMYATPIIYPLSVVPRSTRWVILLNPMTAIVESFRHAYLGVGGVNAWQMLVSWVITLFILMLGLIFFGRAEKTFIDTI